MEICVEDTDCGIFFAFMEKDRMGKFYESKRWKKKREHILRRDEYKCQESKRYGKYEEATTVHHIYPLEDYPELALVDWNLISMSGAQHDRMHDRKTGKVTERGAYWQRKRQKEFETWKPPSTRNKKVTQEKRDRGVLPIAREF